MLMRIKPEQATLGMYVQKFDGTWLEHPFWRARFLISTEDDLLRVRQGGTDLIIDCTKGASIKQEPSKAPALARSAPSYGSGPRAAFSSTPVRAAHQHNAASSLKRIVSRPAFGKADRARAAALARRSSEVVHAMFEDCRLGRSLPESELLAVVADIGDLLEQNSAAFASVTRLKALDDDAYTHSVAVCALMISLAREMGLPPAQVQELGVAGLLHDIGKVEAPRLANGEHPVSEPNDARVAHVERGHALLLNAAGIPAVALDVALNHHERLNGSGFPGRLAGNAASTASRMAAICDAYENLTTYRPGAAGLPAAEAVADMDRAPAAFDPSILFKFMRSVGVYPRGKLIRLRSNRLGVVLRSDHGKRPVARAFYATVGSCYLDYEDVILDSGFGDDQAIGPETPELWFSRSWDELLDLILQGKPLGQRS